MTNVHLAQINIGRMKGPLDGPVMAGFMARLDDLNALADRSDGFVWRLQGDEGNNTYMRPYEDERIIVNMSVWETIDQLRAYVYGSAHAELLKQRRDWFESQRGCLWRSGDPRRPPVSDEAQSAPRVARAARPTRSPPFKTHSPDCWRGGPR